MTAQNRLLCAGRCLTAGGLFLAAAAVFHFSAAPHIAPILRRTVDAKAFTFLEPIVSFTFLLNAVLLLPLSFTTLYGAAGVRRGERWAWRISIANPLTGSALPCPLLHSMGLGDFASAALFLAGDVSITAAGLVVLLPPVRARRGILPPA